MNLRDPRLWHWRQTMLNRNTQRIIRAYGGSFTESDIHGKRADFHIKCVQTLNMANECLSTTAEHDDEINYKSRPDL